MPVGFTHVYNQFFTIRVRERDELREHLRSRGIRTGSVLPEAIASAEGICLLGI